MKTTAKLVQAISMSDNALKTRYPGENKEEKKGINKNELTAEQIRKAMKCRNVEELMEFAKAEGFEITKEEAESYLEELSDIELDKETLDKVAGGMCWNCLDDCGVDTCPCRD